MFSRMVFILALTVFISDFSMIFLPPILFFYFFIPGNLGFFYKFYIKNWFGNFYKT